MSNVYLQHGPILAYRLVVCYIVIVIVIVIVFIYLVLDTTFYVKNTVTPCFIHSLTGKSYVPFKQIGHGSL